MKKRKMQKGILICLSLFLTIYFAGCVDNSNRNPVVTLTINSDNENLNENGGIVLCLPRIL